MLTPKTSVVPPGGFHFFESLAGTRMKVEGTSLEDTARQLLLFRLGNNLPPGTPLQEVSDYICTNWSHFCVDSDPAEVKPTQAGGAGLAAAVAAWMSDFVRVPNSPQPDSVALRRAEICAACPNNVQYSNGCGACMDTISRLSFVSRAGRTTPYDSQLLACSATKQHNASAIWANNFPAMSPEQEANLASNCWRKKA